MKDPESNTRGDNQEPPAPPKLAVGFKQLPYHRVFVPRSVDEAILRAANERLTPRWKRTDWMRHLVRWLAFPAAALVVLSVYLSVRPNRDIAADDINQDGQVDILDAFQLARLVQSNGAAPDINGDGIVNDRDAEALAIRAVKLDLEERS